MRGAAWVSQGGRSPCPRPAAETGREGTGPEGLRAARREAEGAGAPWAESDGFISDRSCLKKHQLQVTKMTLHLSFWKMHSLVDICEQPLPL